MLKSKTMCKNKTSLKTMLRHDAAQTARLSDVNQKQFVHLVAKANSQNWGQEVPDLDLLSLHKQQSNEPKACGTKKRVHRRNVRRGKASAKKSKYDHLVWNVGASTAAIQKWNICIFSSAGECFPKDRLDVYTHWSPKTTCYDRRIYVWLGSNNVLAYVCFFSKIYHHPLYRF